MLGMGAMMGATLQAPLAALIALLELTANPNIILPGMLAVIASGITSSHLFGRESVFLTLLKARGLDYRSDPIEQLLRRIGVASVLNVSFVETEHTISDGEASSLLTNLPLWIAVRENKKTVTLLLAADLSRYLSDTADEYSGGDRENNLIDLLKIPAKREDAASIDQHATLKEALDTMNEKNVDALYVTIHNANITADNNSIIVNITADNNSIIVGIVTRQTIKSQYNNKI
jgi:CIC family chloride channel protein